MSSIALQPSVTESVTLDGLIDTVAAFISPAAQPVRTRASGAGPTESLLTFRVGDGLPDGSLQFHFTDQPALNHRFDFKGDEVTVRAGSVRDSRTLETDWLTYEVFATGRDVPEAFFLNGDWRFPHGRTGPYDFFETGPYLFAIARLRPSRGVLPEDLPMRVDEASRRLGPIETVARIERPGREQFMEQYARPGLPVIIRNATQGDAEELTLDRIRQFYGGKSLMMAVPGAGVLGMPLDPFIDRLMRGDPMPLKLVLPLTRDFRLAYGPPDYFPRDAYFQQAENMIMAHADAHSMRGYGAATAWHRDWADNFLTQLAGRKQLWLAPPFDAECFYLRDRVAARYNNVSWDRSAVHPRTPNLAEHPRFQDAHLVKCVLEPGDTLYLPCGWWHNVANLTASVCVNSWKVSPHAEILTEP
jgi:hypothetical protein